MAGKTTRARLIDAVLVEIQKQYGDKRWIRDVTIVSIITSGVLKQAQLNYFNRLTRTGRQRLIDDIHVTRHLQQK